MKQTFFYCQAFQQSYETAYQKEETSTCSGYALEMMVLMLNHDQMG
jgi:hypothetical protein